MLSVVEHDQHVEIADRGQDVDGGPSVTTEAKRGHDGVGHGCRVRDARQLDEAGSEFGALCGAARDLEGETCLADAARAGEGDEAGVADELGDELHVVVAADERRRHQGGTNRSDRPISDGVPVAGRGAASFKAICSASRRTRVGSSPTSASAAAARR